MQLKVFELRDRGTFIPVIALRMEAESTAEAFLLQRAGYGQDFPLVLVVRMECRDHKIQATYDPFDWLECNNRTLHYAHLHIADNWDKLYTGQVIDVAYLLGETEKPKESERSYDFPRKND